MPPTPSPCRVAAIAVVVFVVAASATAAGQRDHTAGHDHDARHAEIRERGASVMPFDLDETLHGFVKTASGGEQVVVARDPLDAEQIALVREHLAAIARDFGAGRFDDPVAIHGAHMAGLDVLMAKHTALTVTYYDLPDGSLIVFASNDPDVVAAIHAWFDAQVGDHASDAVARPIDGVTTEASWRQAHPGVPVPASFLGR